MSTHRRSPNPPPARSRQVAGLRKPGSPSPSPRPRPTPYSAQNEDPADAPVTEVAETQSAVDEVPATGVDEVETEPPVDAPVDDAVSEDVVEDVVEDDAQPARAEAKPKAKARDGGELKPTAEADVLEGQAEPEASPAGRAAESDGKGRALVGILMAVGVVLAPVAGLFGWLYFDARGVVGNQALADKSIPEAARTAQAAQGIQDAVENVLSYRYDELDKHEIEAKDVITGGYAKEFSTLYCAVKTFAPEQKLVAATTVQNVAVMEMDDETATALVFVSAEWSRGNGQGSKGGGALHITVTQDGPVWKISEMTAHGQPPTDPKNTPANC